jgi:membrane-associated phospholipid phosphatase
MMWKAGQVRSWNLTAQDVINNRPPAPPSTSSEQMRHELEEVKWYAENATREQWRIVHFWADGAGTYTPPGHWNYVASEYIAQANMSEVRAARAFALLNMALHDAAVSCWDAKYFYFNPRPTQLDPSIKTSTGIPNFPAYVSGHSTFSAAAAEVLGYLFPTASQTFADMAQEASLSRLYGGIHYRSDCEEGLKLGRRVGAFTVQYALGDNAN